MPTPDFQMSPQEYRDSQPKIARPQPQKDSPSERAARQIARDFNLPEKAIKPIARLIAEQREFALEEAAADLAKTGFDVAGINRDAGNTYLSAAAQVRVLKGKQT